MRANAKHICICCRPEIAGGRAPGHQHTPPARVRGAPCMRPLSWSLSGRTRALGPACMAHTCIHQNFNTCQSHAGSLHDLSTAGMSSSSSDSKPEYCTIISWHARQCGWELAATHPQRWRLCHGSSHLITASSGMHSKDMHHLNRMPCKAPLVHHSKAVTQSL